MAATNFSLAFRKFPITVHSMNNVPQKTLQGLVFFPVPVIPARPEQKNYFNRHTLPDVPHKYERIIADLFFVGGTLPNLSPIVDRKAAAAAIRAWLSSREPAHEAKVATTAYALWVWSEMEVKYKIFDKMTLGSHMAKDLNKMFDSFSQIEVFRQIRENGKFESNNYVVTVK